MLICMRVIPARPLREPTLEVKVRRSVQAQCITVKQIRDECIVSISGELVGHQLRVLPDADYVGEKEDRGFFVDGLACGLGDVGFDVADFDGFAGWLAAVVFVSPIFYQLLRLQRRPRERRHLLVLHTNGAASRRGIGCHFLSIGVIFVFLWDG
jgi:hypothetical protein